MNYSFIRLHRFAPLSLLCGCFVYLTTMLPGLGQATRSTILTNGPTSNRINIAVLSEGYQTNQLGKFLVDATNVVNNLLAASPYNEYRSYFNAFAISVASTNSSTTGSFP